MPWDVHAAWHVALACFLASSVLAQEQRTPAATPPTPAAADVTAKQATASYQAEERWTLFAAEQNLADLLDACSAISEIPIEYVRGEVSGPLTVRLTEPLTPRSLLALAHRALATKGLTTVQMPGSPGLTVVPLEKAASLARLEAPGLTDARAGFVKLLIELSHDRTESVAAAVGLLLSRSGTVTAFKDVKSLLVADLRPHVEQALQVARRIDGPWSELDVVEIRLSHTTPLALVALLERISQTKKSVFGERPAGTLLAHPEGKSVLVVAPIAEHDVWHALVKQFDRVEPVQTLNYFPRRFSVRETAKLIGDVVPKELGSENWRIVSDELTGTLVITASPGQHQAVQDLLNRLESSEKGPRRPLRSFPVKHRSVEDLRDLLVGMLERGALHDLPEVSEAPSTRVVDRIPDTERSNARTGTEGANSSSRPSGERSSPSRATTTNPSGGSAPIEDTSMRATTDVSAGLGDDLILSADTSTNRLIAMGTPRVLAELERLIAELDVREPQVLVEAMVVTLSETQTRDLGVELQKMGLEGDVQYKLGSLFGLGAPPPTDISIPALAGSGGSGVVLDPGSFSALVRALETINQGRSLTMPRILVSNQATADLGSVLQTPFASTNASNTVATTSFGGTQDAGTQVSVTPRITEGDELAIEYSISLSSFVGDAADPALPPPRQETKLRSTAIVPDGFTVAVGGLEIESEGGARSLIPLLGSIPLVGPLFSSESKTRTKSRFFVFLRTSVLRDEVFEDLRYASERDLSQAGIDDAWPRLEPRVIR